MKKLKVLCFAVILICTMVMLVGCGKEEKNDEANQTENEVINEVNKPEVVSLDGYKKLDLEDYSVQYKEDWTYQENNNTYEESLFIAPSGTDRVTITKEDLPAVYTLEQYKNASVTNLKTATQIATINEEKATINGYEAYRLVYNMTTSGITVEVQQTILVKDKTAFVITFVGTDAGTAEVYHNMENTFIMN